MSNLINNEVKNTATDSAGYLIDKFSDTGKVIISVFTDVFTKKISFKLASNKKDLFAHLLTPPSTLPMTSINKKLENDTAVCFTSITLPSGMLDSLTLLTDDFDKIESFEIACFGNTTNVITGAKKWFYISSDSMTFDGKSSFRISSDIEKTIVPYSYNFIAYKINFKQNGFLLGNEVEQSIRTRLKNLDIQWSTTDIQLSTITEIPSTLTKAEIDIIPFIQFNLLGVN